MKLSYYTTTLQLHHPFAIARGTRTTHETIIVEIEHEGITGIGEASPSLRYGETIDATIEFFSSIDFSSFAKNFKIEHAFASLYKLPPGFNAGKAALDIALNDWMGKRLNKPLWKLWKFSSSPCPASSFTIAGGTIKEIEQKVRAASDYPILKIKLGFEHDIEIMQAVRDMTDKPLLADANEGWKTKEEALDKILYLQRLGIELVEQPLPASDIDGMKWLKQYVKIPLFADESCVTLQDLTSLKGVFDGINVKLMKCGGLRNALQMIYTAKKILGMKVMLGCMIETSVGISAAAQLSSLVHYCDLDGSVLINNDPFEGIKNIYGKIYVNDEPGIGVKKILF